MNNVTNISNETSTVAKATELLAKWLGEDASAFEEARFDSYGLTVLEIGSDSYAVGTDAECDAACSSYIESSVWAFNAEFIVESCGLPYDFAEVIRAYQEKRCEGANDALLQIINAMADFPSFVRDAIAADGRAHFIASYDHNEIELGDGLFAYRIG